MVVVAGTAPPLWRTKRTAVCRDLYCVLGEAIFYVPGRGSSSLARCGSKDDDAPVIIHSAEKVASALRDYVNPSV